MTTTLSLPSVFTPPASCFGSNQLYQIRTDFDRTTMYYAQYGPPVSLSSDCYPPGFAYSAFYSPGVCPQGYTATYASASILPGAKQTQTTQVCCPSGFSYQASGTAPFYSSLHCTSGLTAKTTFQATFINVTTTTTSIVGNIGDGFNAYGIEVRFQSTDNVPATAIASTTSGNSPSGASATSTGPAKTGTSACSSSGMSTGAKAGISVGFVLAALLTLAMLWVGYIWGKRQANRTAQHFEPAPAGEQPKEVHGQYMPNQTVPPYELAQPSPPVHQIQSVNHIPPQELSTSGTVRHAK